MESKTTPPLSNQKPIHSIGFGKHRNLTCHCPLLHATLSDNILHDVLGFSLRTQLHLLELYKNQTVVLPGGQVTPRHGGQDDAVQVGGFRRDGGVGKTALTIQVTLLFVPERYVFQADLAQLCLNHFGRDIRPDDRRFIPKAGSHRLTVLHALSSRYCRTGGIYRFERSVDPRRRRVHFGLQYHVSSVLHPHTKVPQPDSTRQRIDQRRFADHSRVPRIAYLPYHASQRSASASHAGG